MIRRKEEQTIVYECICGGKGETEERHILNDEKEMYGKGWLFDHMVLQPGDSLGYHVHNNDNEVFYILSGTCEYDDNGSVSTLKAGDTAICNIGEGHGMVNTGDVPLEFIALILYK